jgi:hypothetical protein
MRERTSAGSSRQEREGDTVADPVVMTRERIRLRARNGADEPAWRNAPIPPRLLRPLRRLHKKFSENLRIPYSLGLSQKTNAMVKDSATCILHCNISVNIRVVILQFDEARILQVVLW